MQFKSQLSFLEVRFPQRRPKRRGEKGTLKTAKARRDGLERGKRALKTAKARGRDLENVKTYPNLI